MSNTGWNSRGDRTERNASSGKDSRTTLHKAARWLFLPPDNAPPETVLLRIMAGSVFFWEGVMKFIFPTLGVKRFMLIGFPAPHLLSNFVGSLEIVGGLLLIAGLLTRAMAIPFIIEMIVAIVSTKIPMLLGTSRLPLAPVPPQVGIWAVLHDGRSDFAQILTVLFLLIAGPGKWSLDSLLAAQRAAREEAVRGELAGA